MGVSIKYFETDIDFQKELVELIVAMSVIPVIGSGFTRGFEASNGQVPSGKDLEKYMSDKIINEYPDLEDKIKSLNFSDTCTAYEKYVPKKIRNEHLLKNFTNVIIPKAQKEFLNIQWECVYTLNIDDGIERNSNLTEILPLEDFCEDYTNKNRCVFKIHGDVNHYLKYSDSNKMIFKKSDYIDSLITNSKMLTKFKSDFYDNNILYIGCSLMDEPDLISAINQTKNGDSFNHTKIFYICTKEPDAIDKAILEDYGINTYIIIEDYIYFYKTINELYKGNKNKNKEFIDFYKNPKIVKNEPKCDNLKFMLESDNVYDHEYANEIFLPKYFISRSIMENIKKNISVDNPIQFLHGHRVCGKTYCLIDLLEEIKDKEKYFFPSIVSVSSKIIDSILLKKNSLFLFDTNSISSDEIAQLISNVELLKENKNFVVVALNISDRYTTDFITNKGGFLLTKVSNVFDKRETTDINAELMHSNLPTFISSEQKNGKSIKHTILDNLVDIAKKHELDVFGCKLPNLENCNYIEIAAILVLVVKQQLSISDLSYFDINKEISSYTNKYSVPLIEYSYIPRLLNRSDSKTKIVLNARYWFMNCLGYFEQTSSSQKKDLIIKAYKYIYEKIKENESDSFKSSRKMLDFVKFDVINDIFYKKESGSIALINSIYEGLESELNYYPQFKHQRAKSILWLKYKEPEELKKALKYISLAEDDTDKMIKNNFTEKLNISLSHIRFTKCIILGRLCNVEEYKTNDTIVESINSYFSAIIDENNSEFAKNLRNDKRNYGSKFKDLSNLLDNCKSIDIKDGQIKKKINELNSFILTGKKMRY